MQKKQFIDIMKTLIEFVKENLKKKVFLFDFDIEAEIVGYNLYLNSIIVRPLNSSFGWKERSSVDRGKEKILVEFNKEDTFLYVLYPIENYAKIL